MKRAEQPPPGYFNTFAGKVLARIEAEGLVAPRPWWVRWLAPATWSPGMAVANTAIVAGLALLGGTAWFYKTRPEPQAVSEGAADVPFGRVASLREHPPTNPPLNPPGLAQMAGFDPLPFLRSSSSGLGPPPTGLVQFRFRQPSVREQLGSASSEGIPQGIFEPWSVAQGLPTSIVQRVESR